MTPGNIVGMAAVKGLNAIAVTDHNSCKNCPAVAKLAEQFNITAIPGMELCTSEEVHVLCLFETLEGAMDFDRYVHSKILPVKNRPDIFGKQQIMDCNDCCTDIEPLLLIGSADISFDDVFHLTAKYGGLMIPAHIDKTSNSLIANLGFVPPDSRFTCFELKSPERHAQLEASNPYLKQCRMLCNSDAHYLWDIHEPVNFIEADAASPPEILSLLSKYII